jgi:hypothetical protein
MPLQPASGAGRRRIRNNRQRRSRLSAETLDPRRNDGCTRVPGRAVARCATGGNTSVQMKSESSELHDVPESDWKVFRELRELALERFCKRVLENIQPILHDASRTHHERYLDVFRFLKNRDKELAHAFNDPRRSRMIVQLAAIQAYGLLEPHELGRFTAPTRATIESLAKEFTR